MYIKTIIGSPENLNIYNIDKQINIKVNFLLSFFIDSILVLNVSNEHINK